MSTVLTKLCQQIFCFLSTLKLVGRVSPNPLDV
nr:MAG TPA: hypothetical protein [Caudoviricetes sp.]